MTKPNEEAFVENELGRMSIPSGHRRTLVVEDASEDNPELSRPLPISAAQMQQVRNNYTQTSLSPGAKKRAEILTGLGRASSEVNVDGVTFSMRTLKQIELREIIKTASNLELGSEQAYELRVRTLAYSIYAIDGQPVGLAIGSDAFEDWVEVINNMDETIVSYLHRHYTDLNSKNKVKYNLTEEEAKEVVEDIKKS